MSCIGQRSYCYPSGSLFADCVQRANKMASRPVFYMMTAYYTWCHFHRNVCVHLQYCINLAMFRTFRAVLVASLAMVRGVIVFLEQPSSSLMEMYRRWRWMSSKFDMWRIRLVYMQCSACYICLLFFHNLNWFLYIFNSV